MGSGPEQFAGQIRVTDGATGTQLQRRGLPPGLPPEVWNIDNPDDVEGVARSYVEAGSDVILTNSFGANRFALADTPAGQRVSEVAEAAAALARKVVSGTDVKVFGSVGPSGKIVMMEEVCREDLAAAFAEAAEALAWGGVDAIVLESFGELSELEIALEAVRLAADVPVVASMTFASGPDGTVTVMGNKPADLARAAAAGGAFAVGANCGLGPETHAKVAALLAGATDLPIWIKPNAGMPVLRGRRTVFPMGPEQFAAHVPRLIEAGARFVGGCCGTTPEHIRAVRAAVDARR
jgi:methionine synthase I (cobalamin-dependent)